MKKGLILLLCAVLPMLCMAQGVIAGPPAKKNEPRKEQQVGDNRPSKQTTQNSPAKPTRPSKQESAAQTSARQEETSLTQPSGSINGHDYVDLGLSVVWATCNVGASISSDYGDYYAWGETTIKSEYTEANSRTYGKSIGDISGNADYDAARANWGGTWRLPTKAECQELVDRCTWKWTTRGGHNGYDVTGPNGKSIFLPAAGWRYESSSRGVGDLGNYWSSAPYEEDANRAYRLFFDSVYNGVAWYGCFGMSIRPVSQPSKQEPATQALVEEEEITVSLPGGNINGHDYVDLGLSVKWATCNVGASVPSDYGGYYAWGETTYDPGVGKASKTEYMTIRDISGNADYDAARANWGGTWRLPTKEEYQELIDKCTWKWTTQDGHTGYNVKGPNGNSIFVPAAGYRVTTVFLNVGELGYYWSSTPYEDNSYCSYHLFFNHGDHYVQRDRRGEGGSLRPVSDEKDVE